MLAHILKFRTAQDASKPTPSKATKNTPKVRRPAVLGEPEVWTRRVDPSAPQAKHHKMELVPPKRGQGAGQGCWFTEESMVCIPFGTCVDTSAGMKGCFCFVPVCCGR